MLKIASPFSNFPPFLSPLFQITNRIKSKELNTHNIDLKHYVTHLYSIPKIAITLLSQKKKKKSNKRTTCTNMHRSFFMNCKVFVSLQIWRFLVLLQIAYDNSKTHSSHTIHPKKSFVFLSHNNCPLSKSTQFSHAQTKKHKAIHLSTYSFLVCFAFSRSKRVCSKSLFMSSCKRRSNVKTLCTLSLRRWG